MTREQLDEIEKRWAGYLEKNEVERRFLFDRWWDKRDFWDMTKALREAWEERDEARAEVERLREVVKNSFTLEQITETMLKAIDETTRDPTPMPRRPRRLETKEGVS